jgi:site-specific DNA-methyltransferase (adenine-specific)
MRIGKIHPIDCLRGLARLDTQSVDFVFADLPYGRTQSTWDKLIPAEQLWSALRRVCKPTAAMVFTAIQPFTSLLVCSNLSDFRYEMIWKKNKTTGFLNAKRQPLRSHESVLVFYRQQPAYVPQMTESFPGHAARGQRSPTSVYGAMPPERIPWGGSTKRHPTSVLEIPIVNNDSPERIHVNQKPEALPAWFIKTYTRPGDTVLDPTAGSGATLVAAANLGRQYVGFETDVKMAALANARLTGVTRKFRS